MNLAVHPADCLPHTLSASKSLTSPQLKCFSDSVFVNKLFRIYNAIIVVYVWLAGLLAVQPSRKGFVSAEIQVPAEASCLSAWLTYTGTHHMCPS